MSEYELIIRGGEVVTAADKFRADVGVRGGKIVAIADKLIDGARVIDASGLLVMPGGIDSHVHLAQNAFGGPKMADGFETGTRSAIAGGNTTVLPFALQPRGASLRASVMAYHKEADGNSYCDYGFHLIVTDPTPSVLGQELPALVADGYSSFKVFMTYDDMVLNDRQMLEVFECARGMRRAGDGPLRGLRRDQVHDRSGSRRRARRRPITTPFRGPRWSSARRPTARSATASCSTRRS